MGAGVSGMCMAMLLTRAGLRDFIIFEKSERLGGTWRDNTYPGSGCDVPSHLYCFSFEPNPDWTRKFAEQEEILAYLGRCADKYQLRERIRFGAEVASARFDPEQNRWVIVCKDGSRILADILVSATGQLNRPHVPAIRGLDGFTGRAFHSARWDHESELRGAAVAIIGNGASAIQLVPHVAERCDKLTVFQRSAHWIVPKPDRAYRNVERWLFRRVPALARAHRYSLYWQLEGRFAGFKEGSVLNRVIEHMARRELNQVADPDLRAKLTPNYPIGCKRILISNDYYATVQRPNVSVVTERIEHIGTRSVETATDQHPADVIIFATGFESTELLAPMEIVGTDDRLLHAEWRRGPEAYLGMSVAGFPNLFVLYGPNTNLGHNSIIFMIECQVRYVIQCLQAMARGGFRRLEVKPDVMAAYNAEIQAMLKDTVWSAGCDNWYQTEDGKIVNNWASYTPAYWWRTRAPDLTAYALA